MIRTTKIEVWKLAADDQERRRKWIELGRECQRMLNRMWAKWMMHHEANGSADLIREHLEKFAAWKAAKGAKADKPGWPVVAIDKHLANTIYHDCASQFPSLTSRARVLLQNKWAQTITARKAANGSLPGWVAILFHHESWPSFTSPQPIPFDRDNAKLIAEGGKQYLELRLERDITSNKTAKPSIVERCELMTNRRKAASQKTIIGRIISGDYTMKGSSLFFDARKGKFYALLSYEMPKAAEVPLHCERTLYLIPGKKSPWMACYVDERGQRSAWRIGGRGSHVEHARRAILRERGQRQEHNRWGGSARKGHGRRHAEAVWTKLSSRWKDFVKRYNHEMTTRVVRLCVAKGIGRVVFCQPVDRQRDKTYLAKAGNFANSVMTWDWFQVGTLLAYKCEERGVDFATHKTSGDSAGGVHSVR